MADDEVTRTERLLPRDPAVGAIARDLYDAVADAPIIAPHGHVPPAVLADDAPFEDPATLFVTPDHYVTRLLHAEGVPLDRLGVGGPAQPREVWRLLWSHWAAFVGTASGYWLREELRTVFGIETPASVDEADDAFDVIASRLAEPAFRPRALFERFGISVLATTDDPLDDLDSHRLLADDPTFAGRVLPTFRPDAYTNARRPEFADRIDALLASTGDEARGFAGYLDALRSHRARFIGRGATSVDLSTRTADTAIVDRAEAEALFTRLRRGSGTAADADLFDAVMLVEHARMSVEDGLVLTLHPGSVRNHHTPTWSRYGPDTGHDIPARIEFTEALRPLLDELGTAPDLHLVLYTLDETVYSRELAPLAGFYPSVYLGSPWWFLDAPDALARFRSSTIETAGVRRYAGFVDDTRAFCSIPVRHDVARRVDAGVFARFVAEGRMTAAEAFDAIRYTVREAPAKVFKL